MPSFKLLLFQLTNNKNSAIQHWRNRRYRLFSTFQIVPYPVLFSPCWSLANVLDNKNICNHKYFISDSLQLENSFNYWSNNERISVCYVCYKAFNLKICFRYKKSKKIFSIYSFPIIILKLKLILPTDDRLLPERIKIYLPPSMGQYLLCTCFVKNDFSNYVIMSLFSEIGDRINKIGWNATYCCFYNSSTDIFYK